MDIPINAYAEALLEEITALQQRLALANAFIKMQQNELDCLRKTVSEDTPLSGNI
jgi:hypothetical protein